SEPTRPVSGSLAAQVEREAARRRWRDRAIEIASPLVLVALWEALSRGGLLDTRFFPPPTSVVSALVQVVADGSIFPHIWATLGRVGAGLLIGGCLGVAAGLVLGLVRIVRVAMMPILAATMPIPKIALLPLLVLLLGLGNASKIAIVAIGVFFIMIYNTMAGVIAIPATYREVGRSFQASPLNFYRTVALPGALPVILTGVKLSFAVGLLIVVPAEWSGVTRGVGYFTNQAWQVFDIPTMYVGFMVLGLIG